MKKESLWNATVILILASLVAITLTPLALMFRTSLKPAGTLTRNFGELKLTAETGTGSVVRLRLGQDLRKFSTLSFLIRGTLYRGTFEVIFYDMQGNWCAADSSPYLKGGIGNQWRRFTLPLQNLPIASINPGFPEKIAEVLIVRAQDPENPITLKEIKLTAKKFSLANYADVLISASFGRYLFNSALIAIIITLGNLVFCTLAGYAFARKDFPFKNLLFMLILASVIIPAQVLIIPIFLVMKNIGWLNSYLALIIPSLVQPFGIFLMKQYISSLPTSYEDQARVDGATERQILFKIIFPLSRPALAIVGINTFMGAWNTFLFPFILTNTPEMRTLPVGLALYKNLQGADWVHLMAGSSLTAIPVILVFLIFQKHIIAGLTTGLVKR